MILQQLLYVDPGSGSYFLQVMIAAALGAGFALKTWWWRVKAFFSGKKRNEANTSDNIDPNSQS